MLNLLSLLNTLSHFVTVMFSVAFSYAKEEKVFQFYQLVELLYEPLLQPLEEELYASKASNSVHTRWTGHHLDTVCICLFRRARVTISDVASTVGYVKDGTKCSTNQV